MYVRTYIDKCDAAFIITFYSNRFSGGWSWVVENSCTNFKSRRIRRCSNILLLNCENLQFICLLERLKKACLIQGRRRKSLGFFRQCFITFYLRRRRWRSFLLVIFERNKGEIEKTTNSYKTKETKIIEMMAIFLNSYHPYSEGRSFYLYLPKLVVSSSLKPR